MKKIILMMAAISFMATNISAQDSETDSRDKLHFGAKVGINYSNVYDSEGEQFNADAKIGLAAGGFVSIPVGKYLGVQPELMLSQKGFQTEGSVLGSDYKNKRTTTYIEVPLLIALKPSPFLTLLAGPQFSFLIKEKNEFTGSLFSSVQEQEFENNNIRKNILGFVLGADINVSSFVFGLRAAWDVQNNNGDGTSTNPRYKNMLYQGTIGFRF